MEAASGRAVLARAWALKDACYAAWSSEPQRAVQAAQELAELASGQAAQADAAQRTELDALAAWTGGIALVTQGRMAEALTRFEEAGELFAGLDMPGNAAQTQVPRIMALSMLGRHLEAADCAERTHQAFLAQGDLLSASKVSLNLGSLHLRHDAYADAARHYRSAAVLFSRAGDREHSVMADIGLGDALAALGDMDEADRIYARARSRAGAHGLAVLEAVVDESQALLALARGRYGAALAGFERSRAGYERLAMPQHLAIAEKQLADAYLELRLLPESLALYDPAMQQFEALDMPDDTAWALVQAGRAHALLGQSQAATARFLAAAQLFSAQGSAAGQATVALARAELALARPAGSADALDLATEAAQGYAASGLADGAARASVARAQALLARGDAAQAEQLFGATLAEARAAQRLSVQVRCLTGLGQAAAVQGKATAARSAFEAAITLFEDQRQALPGDEIRSAFLADHLLPYRELLRAALDAHDAQPGPANAQAVLVEMERVRSRVLGERLSEPATGPDALADEQIDSLRSRVSWLTRRAQGLEHDDSPLSPALEEELRRSERELLERVRRARLTRRPGQDPTGADQPLDVDALRDALGAEECLLEYGVIDDELFACVVRREGVVLQRRLAAWPAVLQALRSARFQIETLSHGAEAMASHLPSLTARCQARMAQLHGLVWQPLLPLLQGCGRILVVAPAQLGALPFAALHDGQGPLAERHELAFAPSARTALHGLARRVEAPRPALVMAESSHLAHAAGEACRVAALFDDAALCIDENATLERLRELAPGAGLIHLACHARFRSDNPAFSALHLNDGALTVEMIEQMSLRPALVVLSGCETGLVDGAGGDEQVGLVRAFLVAGAARVVASLWPVDDAVTGQFMAGFHVALSRGMTPAQALRLAQVALMRQHPHPFHWAAFTLQGGW